MKRAQIVCVLTFNSVFILTFYLLTRTKLSYNDNKPIMVPVVKDKMKFISTCRKQAVMNEGLTNELWTSRHKNPCFHRGGRLHCLPYFYVIGFPKCGTTDLFSRMKFHPEFIPPLMKELHWLSRYRFLPIFRQKDTVEHGKYAPNRVYGLHLYTHMFTELASHLSKSKETTYAISADFSPSTIWDNDLYTYLGIITDNTGYYTHDFLYGLNPCAKLVVMMRDPAERLYSDYLFIEGKTTPEDFHNQVKYTIEQYENCMKTRTPRDCMYDYIISKKSKVRLRIGAYSVYIDEWMKNFPREQMHFIRMEDYAKNAKNVLKELINFLDMEPASNEVMERMLSEKPSNTRVGRGEVVEPMLNKTYMLLNQFYAPFNANLSILLKNNDYSWSNG